MLLPVGARCPWKLIGFLVLTGAVASSLDWTDPINESFPELHRREDVHVEPAEPLELRLQVDQYMAHVLGIQGAAFMAFMLAAVMLIRGAWLLTDFVGYRISWFIMGFALGFYWMVYVATPQADAAAQLQLALSLSCHAGVLLALFPQAGCYIIGAGATALAIHLVHESTLAANGANSLAIHVVHARSDVAHASSWLAVLDVAGGALGGYLCNRFRKPALDFVFSLAGSAVMVLMMHWWLNEAFHCCFGPDDSNSSPFQYWLALWSLGGPWNSVVRWWFSFSWLVFFYLGQRLRQRLDITEAERQHRRMQEQLRRAPNDCDRMPWNGSSHGRDGRGLQLPLPATMGSESRPPEEEDFGMYLLPEDLETMKRSKSIPCFTPESRPKIIPLRQTTTLPEPSAPPAPGSTRKPPARRVTLAGRPK